MTTCRACLAPDPYLFLPLGDHAPAQMLIRPEDLGKKQPAFPLNSQVCLTCGLIQVADQIPARFLPALSLCALGRSHDARVTSANWQTFCRRRRRIPGLIVDIGCNDGLLLAACNALGARHWGSIRRQTSRRLPTPAASMSMSVYFDPDTAALVRENRMAGEDHRHDQHVQSYRRSAQFMKRRGHPSVQRRHVCDRSAARQGTARPQRVRQHLPRACVGVQPACRW